MYILFPSLGSITQKLYDTITKTKDNTKVLEDTFSKSQSNCNVECNSNQV